MNKQLDTQVVEDPAETPDYAADPDLSGLIRDVFDDSLELDWVKEYLLSGSASRKESGTTLAALHEALGFNASRHSNWKGGKLRKNRTNDLPNHTRDLQDIFSREGGYYTKDRETRKLVRKFRKDLIDHWVQKKEATITAIIRGLEAHVVKLSGEKAREKDAKTAGQVAAILQRSMPNPGYVRALSPETLPTSLEQVFDAFDRDKIVDLMVRRFETPQTRVGVTAVTGPRRSGRSSVLRAFVGKVAENAANGDRPPSLLYIDLTGAATPQRAVYLALKGLGNGNLAPSDAAYTTGGSLDGDERDDDSFAWSDAFSHVKAVLPPPTPGAGQLVVVEGCHIVAQTEDIKAPIQSLIELPNFKSSSFFVEDAHGAFRPRGMATVELQLPPYSDRSARNFLTGPCQVPADLAHPAIEKVSGLEELLYPGPLNFGSFAFKKEHLPYRSDPVDAESLSMSILDAASGIVSSVIEGVLQGDSDASQQALQSLMAMSVVAMFSVSDEALNAAGFGPIPREPLQRLGWFSESNPPRLIGFALHGLRASVARDLKNAQNGEETEFVDAVKRLVAILCGVKDAGYERAIEEAASWLGRTVPEDNPLLVHLRALVIISSTDDEVAPLSQEQELLSEPLFHKAAVENRDLEAGIAALVVTVRRPKEDFATARSDFLGKLKDLMGILDKDAGLNHMNLSAVDSALHLGLRRYQALDEILDARRRILDLLAPADVQATTAFQDQSGREALASFQINAAEGRASVGDNEGATGLAQRASATLLSIPEDARTSYTNWRLARLAILLARLAPEIGDKNSHLKTSCDHALACLQSAPEDIRNARFLLRAVRRFLEVEGSARRRREVLDAMLALLNDLYGDPQHWALELRGRVSSLLRRTIRFERASDRQLEIARQAMQILMPGSDFTEDDLDAHALLAKARLHAILGETKAARRATTKVLKDAPSTEAWLLKLRLESGDIREIVTPLNLSQFEVPDASQIGDALQSAMKEAEEWVQSLPEFERQSPKIASLLLWIRKRRWRSEGSILRSVHLQLEREGKNFSSLPIPERLSVMEREFRQRESSLNGIGRNCPGSIDVTHAKAMNLAQFVRSKALVTGKEPEVERVLELLNKSLTKTHNSEEALLHLAEYQRYVWMTDEAIDNFREVVRRGLTAENRQTATISLTKTLLATCVELDDVDETLRLERLDEAVQLVGTLPVTSSAGPELLLLREHLAFETDGSVDWVELNLVCDTVAKEVDGYLASSLENLEILSVPEEEEDLMSIADALADDFTSREVLASVAQLYYRRGLKGEGNDPKSYFMRAAALQTAVALLERSWLGVELATTRFHLARTVSVAAERLDDPNPIDGLWIGDKTNQLAFAEAKFHGAAMASAGRFRAKAKEWQGHVARQRQAMGV